MAKEKLERLSCAKFVWIKNLRGGYDPQKWPKDMPFMDRPTATIEHDLSEQQASLPLADLIRLFPAPPKETSR